MALDQLTQARIMHRAVREVGTQCQQRGEGATRFGDGGQQQVDEASPLVLGLRLGEEFLELIDQQHHLASPLFSQLHCQPMQPSPGTIGERKTHVWLPGSAPRWRRGRSPAMTRLDLPDPLGPITVNMRAEGVPRCSEMNIPCMVSTSSSISVSRPKKSAASSWVNAWRPLYGLRGSSSVAVRSAVRGAVREMSSSR